MFTIQKYIPVPADGRGSNKKGKSKYPFSQLKIGDSFFVPKTPKGILVYTATAALPVDKRNNYTRRKVTENRVEGVRYWRVK